MAKNKKATWYYSEFVKNNFLFLVGWSGKDFSDYCMDKFNYDVGSTRHKFGMCLDMVASHKGGYNGLVIWVEKKSDYPALAHECIHAVIIALERAGITPCNDTGETLAHMVDTLMEKGLKRGEENNLYEIGD